jgi:hypothetical protein
LHQNDPGRLAARVELDLTGGRRGVGAGVFQDDGEGVAAENRGLALLQQFTRACRVTRRQGPPLGVQHKCEIGVHF